MYDVVIVGYGPVGATLANLLVQQGLRVAVLEREGGVYHLARAGHLDAEVMRVFQSIGIAETIERESGITLGMRFLDADGALLMEWKRGGGKGPLGWVSDYMFHQPTLEKTLRAKLAESPDAHTFLLHDVFAIEDAGEYVRVRAEDTASARLATFEAKYVVGCDGARSLVRRTIGTEHEDLGFKQRWLVIDVKEKRDLGLERVSTQYCNPERPMYASSTTNGMLRWEIMLKPEDDVADVTLPDRIWDFIEQSMRPISRRDGEITRGAVYTFESLIAHQWRKGHLLIAGDAAHRMPPFLGQGMCAGIRDASNLAWKLAAVCKGTARDDLLDTYQDERRPHVTAFTRGAIEAGKFVQMTDPVLLEQRVREMRGNPKAFAPPNPALGSGVSARHGEDGIGRQFPQPTIDGQLLDDRLGHAFALIAGAAFADAAATVATRYAELKVVRLPVEMELLLTPYRAPGVLLRPDRYVHAPVSTVAELAEILQGLPLARNA
jgi:3-(3-hydroxy-phenyl)propionate hydroxylase